MDFVKSETGAVTVDWVVLTAALVGLGLAAMAVVSGGVEDLSNDVDSELTNREIATGFMGLTNWQYTAFDPDEYDAYLTGEWPFVHPLGYQDQLNDAATDMETAITTLQSDPTNASALANFHEGYDAYAAGLDYAADNGVTVTSTYETLYDLDRQYKAATGG